MKQQVHSGPNRRVVTPFGMFGIFRSHETNLKN